MARDNGWDRIEKAFGARTSRDGPREATAGAALEASYAAGVTDEFVVPTLIGAAGEGAVRNGGVVVFFNFRADRAREITRAFTEIGFDRFLPPVRPELASFVCFTACDRPWSVPGAVRPTHRPGLFGQRGSRPRA